MGQLTHKQTGEKEEVHAPTATEKEFESKFKPGHGLAVVKSDAETVNYDAITRSSRDPFFIYTPMSKITKLHHGTINEDYGFYVPVLVHRDCKVIRDEDTGRIKKIENGMYVVVHWNPKQHPNKNWNFASQNDIKNMVVSEDTPPAFFINVKGAGVQVIDLIPFWVRDKNYDSKIDSIVDSSGRYHKKFRNKEVNNNTDIIFLNYTREEHPMTWEEFMELVDEPTPKGKMYKLDWSTMVKDDPSLLGKIYANPAIGEEKQPEVTKVMEEITEEDMAQLAQFMKK